MKNLKILLPILLILILIIPIAVFLISQKNNIKAPLTHVAPNFSKNSDGFTAKNLIFEAKLPMFSTGTITIFANKSLSITPTNANQAQATMEENKILYEEAYSSSNVEYITTPKGLKESIILKSLDNLPSEFSYNFNADDLKGEVAGDNSIVFTQISKEASRDVPVSDGTVLKADKAVNFLPQHPQRFKIPAPVMIDAKGNHSKASDVKVTLTKSTLTLTPSQDWLKKAVFPVILDPTVEVAPEIVSEVADKRTLTSKDFLNTDGSYTSVIFTNPIHYKDSQGKYQDIDRSFVTSNDPNYQYQVKTGVYVAKMKKTLTGQSDIELDFGGSSIGFSPLSISWSNGDNLGKVTSVQGLASSDGGTITYPSLFGITGIDLQGTYDNEKFLKETVISSKDAIQAISHTNDNLEISFALALPSDTDLKVNGKVWDGKTSIETQNAIEIYKDGKYISELRKAIVYGNNPTDINNSQTITIRLSKEGNDLTLTKIIPAGWLAQADYPVKTDSTLTAYPDPNTETTSVDGLVRLSTASQTWSQIRDTAANGAFDDLTESVCTMIRTDGTAWSYMGRGIFLFDTSSIPDDATIDSATLSIYASDDGGTVNYNDFTATDWAVKIYTSNPASNTTLAANDSTTIGATAQSSNSVAIGSWTVGYHDFTLNATGLSNISKTGVSKFAVRESTYDAPNVEPTHQSNRSVEFRCRYADWTGTASDPKLVVTYTPATTAPTITSPTNTSIHGSDATLGGNVTSDGGATITGRGVCVGTSANPALGGNCFSTSGTTGVFTVLATSLTQNTLYHYRAYATNSVGTSYTTDDTFTTLALNNYLVTVVSPQTAGVCSTGTNTVTARDSTNTTITTDTSTVDMTNSGTSVTFYTTSGCTVSTTQYTLSSGVANIYYKTNVAQSFTITATKNGSSETGTSSSITVNAGSMTRLVVTLPSQTFTAGSGNSGSVINQQSGVQFTITKISATDDYFNVVTSYSGAKTLAYSGPSSSGGTPSYTTSVSFTSGQSTTTLNTTLYTAETTTITVTDGGLYGYASSSLTISQTRLVITLPGQIFVPGTGNTGIAISQNAGIQFRIASITLTDESFNVMTSYSGAKTLAYSGPSSSGGTPIYTTSVSFTNGQSTTALLTTLKTPETTTITATDGGSYGYASSSITVRTGGINIRGGP